MCNKYLIRILIAIYLVSEIAQIPPALPPDISNTKY